MAFIENDVHDLKDKVNKQSKKISLMLVCINNLVNEVIINRKRIEFLEQAALALMEKTQDDK